MKNCGGLPLRPERRFLQQNRDHLDFQQLSRHHSDISTVCAARRRNIARRSRPIAKCDEPSSEMASSFVQWQRIIARLSQSSVWLGSLNGTRETGTLALGPSEKQRKTV